MYIGFNITRTGSGKAGCCYFSHIMMQVMLRLASNNEQRDQLRVAAPEQTGWFVRRHSAALLLRLYEEALASPKRRMGA